jgi:hypothetical protein
MGYWERRKQRKHYEATGEVDLRGHASESNCCVDCGVNTAPGMMTRAEIEAAMKASWLAGKLEDDEEPIGEMRINNQSEVYIVHNALWKQAGMKPWGGCLCIGCLEKRIGRRLQPKDFDRDSPFNRVPTGTPRLLNRRDGKLE